MNNPTHEELNLQILSTCMLINAQGKWHAFYNLSAHVGQAEVRIVPSDYSYAREDRDTSAWSAKAATFAPLIQNLGSWLTEEASRQDLIDLLAWAQGYLSMEAAA